MYSSTSPLTFPFIFPILDTCPILCIHLFFVGAEFSKEHRGSPVRVMYIYAIDGRSELMFPHLEKRYIDDKQSQALNVVCGQVVFLFADQNKWNLDNEFVDQYEHVLGWVILIIVNQ